jgi:hypothetical protein
VKGWWYLWRLARYRFGLYLLSALLASVLSYAFRWCRGWWCAPISTS